MIERFRENKEITILILILTFAAALLRLYHIDFNSLWLDEGSTYWISTQSFGTIWDGMLHGEFNPPLFYWITHIVLQILGHTEFALRLVPAIAGILTIPAVYILGKEVMDEKAGIIAAVFMLMSPWHVIYSQEARTYTLTMLVFVIACIYFFRWYKEPTTSNAAAVGILCALSFWLHYYAFIFVAILLLLGFWRHFKKALLPLGIFSALGLPLFIIVLTQLSVRAEASAKGELFGATGFDVITQAFYQLSGFSYITGWVLLGLMSLGLYVLYKKDAFVGLGMLIITAGVFAVSIFIAPYLNVVPRYMCYILPLWWITAACSYRLFTIRKILKKEVKHNYLPVVALVIVVLLTTLPTFNAFYVQPYKNDWRGTAQYIKEYAKSGDAVVFVPGYVHPPFRFYYDKIDYHLAYTVEDMESFKQNKTGTLYYLISSDVYLFRDDPMLQWAQANADKTHRMFGVDIAVVE